MKTLRQILSRGNTVLSKLVHKTQQLRELDELLRGFISDIELAKHCRLAEIKVKNKQDKSKRVGKDGKSKDEKLGENEDKSVKKRKRSNSSDDSNGKDSKNNGDNTDNAEREVWLMVDNAAWATRLHYAIPEILKNIRAQTEFKNVKKIHYAVKTEGDTSELRSTAMVTVTTTKKAEVMTESGKSKIPLCHERLWKEMLQQLKTRNCRDE